jgi:hypothetical protein
MKRMTFTSSVPSHMYDGLHLLERMCCLRLIGVQQSSINENDDFLLVGVQSCVCRSSSSQTFVLASPRQCPTTMCPIPL